MWYKPQWAQTKLSISGVQDIEVSSVNVKCDKRHTSIWQLVGMAMMWSHLIVGGWIVGGEWK